MRAVILAAGQGTRLLPLTKNTPKPLIPVCGRPLLHYTFHALPKTITEVHLVIGHLGSQIKTEIGDRFRGKHVVYHEQKELNGTAGALALLEHVIVAPTLVLNADDLYLQSDLERLIAYPLAVLAVATHQAVAFPLRVSWFNNWTGFKTSSTGVRPALQNAGAYMVDRRYFATRPEAIEVRRGKEFSLPHTLVKVAQMHEVKVVKATAWYPVGNAEELAVAQQHCHTFYP